MRLGVGLASAFGVGVNVGADNAVRPAACTEVCMCGVGTGVDAGLSAEAGDGVWVGCGVGVPSNSQPARTRKANPEIRGGAIERLRIQPRCELVQSWCPVHSIRRP